MCIEGLDKSLPMLYIGSMQKTESTIAAKEIKPGMEVWIGSAWSSHGTKAGYWSRVTTVTTEYGGWDIGDLIVAGDGDFRPDDMVKVRCTTL